MSEIEALPAVVPRPLTDAKDRYLQGICGLLGLGDRFPRGQAVKTTRKSLQISAFELAGVSPDAIGESLGQAENTCK